MRRDYLDESNFLLFAAKHYQNVHCCGTEEFMEDLSRLRHLKKQLGRFRNGGELNERLILNHIIVLGNVFPPEPLIRMMFWKMRDRLPDLKPFLVILNRLPPMVYGIGPESRDYHTDEIPMAEDIMAILRKTEVYDRF